MRSTAAYLALAAMSVMSAAAQVTPLVPPTPFAGVRTGIDVAATGSLAVVGTSLQNVRDGRFYVYRRGEDGWAFEAEIARATELSGFRGDVEASGECVLAAAPWDSYDVPGGGPNGGFHAGSTYVYCRTAQGWARDGVLRPADPVEDGLFAIEIALDGDLAASTSVGGYPFTPEAGAVYVHRRGPSGWAQEAKLQPGPFPAGADYGYLGARVTASGNLVGAAYGAFAGSVPLEESYRVFARGAGGWVPTDTLRVRSDGGAVLAGSRLFLGDLSAPGAPGRRRGVVRVYGRSGGRFVLEATLASDQAAVPPGAPFPSGPNCPFGRVLDATMDTLVAGHLCETSGAGPDTVDVFVRRPSGWARVRRGSIGLPAAEPGWERSYALSGLDLVVGTPGTDDQGAGPGAAFVVPLSGITTAAEPGPTAPAWALAGPYPNPTRGATTFRVRPAATELTVEVTDALGRRVRFQPAGGTAGDGALRVDLGGLPAGVYVVHVVGGGERWSSRVVVTR